MKILLCNTAFIGDLILSTAVLEPLKREMPDCQIGFLVGSWAKEVVVDHSLIDWVHIFDQRGCNRSAKSKTQKRLQEHLSRNRALKEVKAIKYDIGCDLHSYYVDNASYFLSQAKVKERVGYWNSYTPFYYTKPLFWQAWGLPMLQNHRQMLSELGLKPLHLDPFAPCLRYQNCLLSEKHKKLPSNYFLIHMGVGQKLREWPTHHWRELILRVEKLGIDLVFTGQGKREAERIKKVTEGVRGVHVFSDVFNFKELIPVVQRARFIIGLESMISHLAATFGIPSLFIFFGSEAFDWTPAHSQCEVIKPESRYLTAQGRREIYPKLPLDMISVDQVWERLRTRLYENSAHQSCCHW